MKQLKSLVPVPSLKLIWCRLTVSRLTVAFFLIALSHCVIQVGLQAFALSINNAALDFLRDIVSTSVGHGNIPTGIAVFNPKSGELSLCNGIPSASTCHVIWSQNDVAETNPIAATPSSLPASASTAVPSAVAQLAPVSSSTLLPSASLAPAVTPNPGSSASGVVQVFPSSPVATSVPATLATAPVPLGGSSSVAAVPSAAVSPITPPVVGPLSQVNPNKRSTDADEVSLTRQFSSNGTFIGVLVVDHRLAGGRLLATPTCIASLLVPIQSLQDSRRVDLTFVAFQIWVLGMSIVALLNESVPHTLASLLTHMLATAWSVYQVTLTHDMHELVDRLSSVGPCHENFLPHYWDTRLEAEISISVLNAAALAAIGFLSYKLVKSFGWQTFKRVGASLVINRAYQLVLAFSIAIQLSVFFMGADLVLWIDQLENGTFALFSEHSIAYEIPSIFVLAILLPWLTMGWFAVRRETRLWMMIYIILSGVMIGGWTLIFVSSSFRATFQSFSFFAAMTVVAAVLLALTTAMAVWCRLNFGRGLPRYLHPPPGTADDERQLDDTDAASVLSVDEKCVEFPSRDMSPVPTFAETFGAAHAPAPAPDLHRKQSRSSTTSGPSLHSDATLRSNKRWIIE